MNADRTPQALRKPFLPLVIGVALGGAMAWSILYQPGASTLDKPEMIAFFDKASLNAIGLPVGVSGARFYFAANAPGDSRAIMAPVDAGGRHLPEGSSTKFRLYKALNGSRTDLGLLEEPAAEALVKGSKYGNAPAWSIDCPMPELTRMIQLAGCNGIGLAVLRMADGTNTFQLIPVKIANDHVNALGRPGDRITAAPCPNFCGFDAMVYLHRRP